MKEYVLWEREREREREIGIVRSIYNISELFRHIFEKNIIYSNIDWEKNCLAFATIITYHYNYDYY